MPTNSSWNPNESQVDQTAQIAARLARDAHHDAAEALPNLDVGKTLTKSLMERIQDWLNRWLKPSSPPHFDLAFIIEILKWTLILLLIFAIGFLIYHIAIRLRGPAALTSSSAAPSPVLTDDRLQRELEEALGKSQFALAARLRWKIFLRRRSTHVAVTPYEYFRAQRELLEPWLLLQYRTMFARGTPTQPDYDALDAKLRSLEDVAAQP